MSKAKDQLALFGGIVVAIFAAISWFFDTFGYFVPAIALGVGIATYIIYANRKERTKRIQEELRKAELIKRYGNEEVAQKIISQIVWQGETSEQLYESLGRPQDVDKKVLKTKRREVWKYGHEGGNRYRTRITLDNEIVIGWEMR